jgi:hypothetical protein
MTGRLYLLHTGISSQALLYEAPGDRGPCLSLHFAVCTLCSIYVLSSLSLHSSLTPQGEDWSYWMIHYYQTIP